MDSDDMLLPPANSPMFSSFPNDADLGNSILEDDFSSVEETLSHFSSSVLQDAPPEINVEVLFPEALSPDTDVSDALRNFLNGPNMLNEVNSRFLQDEQEGFFLDHFVEEIGYSLSNPLTPWIFAFNS